MKEFAWLLDLLQVAFLTHLQGGNTDFSILRMWVGNCEIISDQSRRFHRATSTHWCWDKLQEYCGNHSSKFVWDRNHRPCPVHLGFWLGGCWWSGSLRFSSFRHGEWDRRAGIRIWWSCWIGGAWDLIRMINFLYLKWCFRWFDCICFWTGPLQPFVLTRTDWIQRSREWTCLRSETKRSLS